MCAINKLVFSCCIIFLALMVVKSEISSNGISKNDKNTIEKSMPRDGLKLIDSLRTQIKTKEEELRKAEMVNKNFERMLQLVNILGQVDSFLTERTKLMIKKLAVLADDDEEEEEPTSKSEESRY